MRWSFGAFSPRDTFLALCLIVVALFPLTACSSRPPVIRSPGGQLERWYPGRGTSASVGGVTLSVNATPAVTPHGRALSVWVTLKNGTNQPLRNGRIDCWVQGQGAGPSVYVSSIDESSDVLPVGKSTGVGASGSVETTGTSVQIWAVYRGSSVSVETSKVILELPTEQSLR